MLTRYPDRAAGSIGSGHQIEHAYEVTGRTHRFNQIEHAYAVSGRAAGSHGFGTPKSYMPTRYQDGLQGLTGLEQQFQHAYEVSGRGCRISRVRNILSNMSGRGCGISQVGNCR